MCCNLNRTIMFTHTRNASHYVIQTVFDFYQCLAQKQKSQATTGPKKLGIITFSILNLKVYFNTSTYVAIMWPPTSPPPHTKMKCTEVWKMTVITISAVSVNGCYFLWIHFRENALLFNNNDTAGIKWWNDGIPGIFEFCLKKKHVFDQKIGNFYFCLKLLSTWMQMQNWKPHPSLSTQTRDMTFEQWSLIKSCIFQCKLH